MRGSGNSRAIKKQPDEDKTKLFAAYGEVCAVSGKTMLTNRFGRKLKLPSTVAIKHQLLVMMLEDEIKAVPSGGSFSEDKSPAIAALRRLKGARV